MSICKRCGCEFEYSMKNGTGYAPDLCGAFCDGVYSERKVSALKIAGLMTQIDELRDERDALAAELASQPLTGDGVRITSGMTVYRHITIRGRHEVQHSLPIRCWPLFQSLADGEPVIGPVMVNPELCYSSREAAEAAREAEKARDA
jgi:hypothetical protein